MRTRFLNIDFFAPENSSFLRLPLPQIASEQLSTAADLLHFDSVPEISLGIDRLNIDSALSKFFDDVLPRRIADDDGNLDDAGGHSSRLRDSTERIFSSGSVGTRFLEAVRNSTKFMFISTACLIESSSALQLIFCDSQRYYSSEEEAKITNEDNMEGGWKNFGSETSETEFVKKDKGADRRSRNLTYNMIQFETPQLDAFLENVFLSEKEEVHILTVLPEVEFNLETLNQGLLKYPSKVKESVYAVEGITSEYLLEQRSCLFENGFAQDQKLLHQVTFPFLEVDEMDLETLTFLNFQDELFFILESAESPHRIQDDNLLVNNEEYLCSMKYDVEEFLSDHFLRPCAASELASPDISGGSDLMILMEILEIPASSAVQTKSSGDLPVGPAIFEEFQLLDIYSSHSFEVFFNLELSAVSEIHDCMSIEDTNFKSFNELIVCRELALVDDMFKSLPVPILSNQGSEKSVCALIEDVLGNLNEQSLSASDGIYLDWHLLEEHSCSSGIYSSYHNMLEEINLKPMEFDQEPCENDSIFYRYVFSDDALVRERTEEKGELKESFFYGISMFPSQTIEVASSKLLTGRCQQKGRQDLAAVVGNTEKVLSSWKSISESNDLSFFLNPQKPAGVRKGESVFSATDANAMLPKVSCDRQLTNQPSMSTDDVSLTQRNVALHQVFLSDNILHLINNSEKTYLAILQNETELRKTYLPCVAEDYFLMLSLPKQKLIDCIKKIYLQGTSTYWEEKIMTLATLYAIKQIAWYLCFYGIHPAHLYLKKLCQSLKCLKSRLGFLLSLIEDADRMVDREITLSHPALTTIQDILCSYMPKDEHKTAASTLKILVVANRIFWWSLKKMFGSLGLSFEELKYESPTNQRVSKANIMVDDLLVSNCMLVSQEHISGSFPFNKFSIILEYGGLNGSSQISTYFSKLIDMPHPHFVMLELDNCGNCKAFCGGVDMPQHNEQKIEEDSLVENKTGMLEKLLNFLPVEETYILAPPKATIEPEDCGVPLLVPVVPLVDKSQHIDLVSFPEAIVIVNTQKFEKDMIVSRRSSYQRILALEKEGVQVVERDLSLPVDLILTSSVCLMWYDCTNIHRKASTSNDASSCLWIDNIATDVLTTLSFTFSGCVLVFEGEISSLSTVMESSDGLYAAAASLEIDFQLFCSYSSELTDEIILGCIENVSKLMTRGLHPKMSESETLAESFLTRFPSINPLTAHGVLSSEIILADFLEWTHERRLRAIKKYCIPDESVSLFSALCKYGEREDSKSVMTDCSSSVSSGPDSEKCHFNVNSENKRRNFTVGAQCIDKNMDFLNSDPLNPFTAVTMEPLAASKPFGSQMFEDPEIFYGLKGLSSSVNHFFDQNHNLESFDATAPMDPISVYKPCESWISTAPEISDQIRSCSSYVQNQGLDPSKRKIHNSRNGNKADNQHKELIGEVVNLIDNPVLKDDFATMAPMNFLPLMFDHDKDSPRKSKIQRRSSHGQSGNPFRSVDIANNSSSDIWSSISFQRPGSQGLNNHFPDPSFKTSIMPLRYQDDQSDEGLIQNSVRDSKVLFSHSENPISHSDATPLSIALRSKHLQESSPWTMEFLNRIREKSRNRRQSVPSGSSSPFPEHLGNVKKPVKRRSPSILEFFKYQGGSTLRKKPEQKRQKQSIQSSNSSKNELIATSELSSWTPIDKRSRKTLSFAIDGNESQTKLVWSNDNYGLRKSSQKLGNK